MLDEDRKVIGFEGNYMTGNNTIEKYQILFGETEWRRQEFRS